LYNGTPKTYKANLAKENSFHTKSVLRTPKLFNWEKGNCLGVLITHYPLPEILLGLKAGFGIRRYFGATVTLAFNLTNLAVSQLVYPTTVLARYRWCM
jgi:hypothetical protein